MMSIKRQKYLSPPSRFENLPDEILLSICRYLSQINILDSLLNLNHRLNQTLTFYREHIFLSHLSYQDFKHLMNDHLPNLASNVNHLYLNSCSMLDVGRIFEQQFNRIDQQFPLLRRLILHQIDIETLENLSWRFNTMNHLDELSIDIADNRLASMPIEFDEFFLGKLFSVNNSFTQLKLHFNKYKFSLHSMQHQYTNLHHLTISVKCFDDLFILFESFPNIAQLKMTIGCPTLHNNPNKTYSNDEQLWWKIPYLTEFDLTIREDELISHANVISHDAILKTIKNIYSLKHLKFTFDIRFNSALQVITTKDIYIDKYLPYANGSLWEQALTRNDNRSIQFELYIKLDRLVPDRLKKMTDSDMFFVDRNDDLAFQSLLKTTFASAYWLQKNIEVQLFFTASKRVSIYTLPITNPCLSTTADLIDQIISLKSHPLNSNIQNLIIRSTNGFYSPKLCIQNLFEKFPCLTHLEVKTELYLPPNAIICSNHLRSLSLYNYSLSSCCTLLEYLPQVISLSLSSSSCRMLNIQSCSKPMVSITRLKLTLVAVDVHNLTDLTEYFPKVNEFDLLITNTSSRISEDIGQYQRYEQFLRRFKHLRYIKIMLPEKQKSFLTFQWMEMLDYNNAICTEIVESNSIILRAWLSK